MIEITNEYMNKYEIFYAFLFFFCFCGKSIISSTSLCLIFEYSIDDEMVYGNYFYYYSSCTISLLISFTLNYLFETFEISFLIIGIVNLIYIIIVYKYVLESPRHYYEFSLWNDLTKVMNTLLGNTHDLDQFYVNKFRKTTTQEFERKESLKQKNEINKHLNRRKTNITTYDLFKGTLSFLIRKSTKKSFFILDQSTIIKNPLILFAFLFYEKKIAHKFLLFISLIIIVLFNQSMISSLMVTNLYFTRDDLYENFIKNRYIWTTIVLLFSNYIFNTIQKFFGFRLVLVICFPFIIVFSLIFQLLRINFITNLTDLNKFDYTKIDIYYNSQNYVLTSFLINSIHFFTNGINYSLFIYMVRHSKSLYRCLFTGLYNVMVSLMIFFTFFLSLYIEKSFLLIILLSLIGIFMFFFIYDEDYANIITDMKKLEINLDE